MSKAAADTSAVAAPRKSFCERSKIEEGDQYGGSSSSSSFMKQLRTHFHDFVHASMEDHKSCFLSSFNKAYEKVKTFKITSGEVKPTTALAVSSKSSAADQ